ncbi:MAG: biotin--[acetyl-CoA-carboxylase] ligase [Actinomycetes bacterium]
MELSDDLDRAHLRPLLGDRPVRTFPAMLSTEAEAVAWARTGAPDGAVVTAGYVAAPRGRSGLDWDGAVDPAGWLACSVVIRPSGPSELDEGWLYLLGTLVVHDVLGAGGRTAELRWPDHLTAGDRPVAAVGVQLDAAGTTPSWAVLTLLAFVVPPPRGPVLASLLDALDRRRGDPGTVVVDARSRCATLGQRVRAHLLPMGPAGATIVGEAVDLAPDGGLVVRADDGARIVVLPQALGTLEDPGSGPMGPAGAG